MRRLLEFFKKIGLLQVGGQAAVYTDARERPLEFTREEMDPTPPLTRIPTEREPES